MAPKNFLYIAFARCAHDAGPRVKQVLLMKNTFPAGIRCGQATVADSAAGLWYANTHRSTILRRARISEPVLRRQLSHKSMIARTPLAGMLKKQGVGQIASAKSRSARYLAFKTQNLTICCHWEIFFPTQILVLVEPRRFQPFHKTP